MLSCIGFLAGAAVGATFSPALARFLVHGLDQQALVAIIVVFITAMIGQLLASLAGVAVRSRVTWRPMALVDSLGGAAVSVVSVLLIAWFIGEAVVPFILGGPIIAGRTLSRVFTAHVFLIPGILIA